jgi:hypothetical protein
VCARATGSTLLAELMLALSTVPETVYASTESANATSIDQERIVPLWKSALILASMVRAPTALGLVCAKRTGLELTAPSTVVHQIAQTMELAMPVFANAMLPSKALIVRNLWRQRDVPMIAIVANTNNATAVRASVLLDGKDQTATPKFPIRQLLLEDQLLERQL